MKRRSIVMLAVGAVCLATGAANAQSSTAKAEEKKAEIGKPAPTFVLKDTEGKEHKLEDYTKKEQIVVLEWFNPGCPVVKDHHGGKTNMIVETQKEFKDKGVVFLAINSGAEGKQGYGIETNAEAKKDFEMAYPILMDETGKVGKAYGAKTTPHMFIIDKEGVLRYMGAPDLKKDKGEEYAETNMIKTTLNAIMADETVTVTTTKFYGCGVKYGR